MKATVAYFSMEIGLEAAIPTYSGGLGILAGDTIRSAADLGINMVAVTLLQRFGYFHQKLDTTGWQTEEPAVWSITDYLEEIPVEFYVLIEDHKVKLQVWRYIVKGVKGHEIPVYFLDADPFVAGHTDGIILRQAGLFSQTLHNWAEYVLRRNRRLQHIIDVSWEIQETEAIISGGWS